MNIDNSDNYIVPDLLDYNLVIVFCGTAPSRISAAKKCYYGNPNNKFWKTLFEIGLVDELIDPTNYKTLLKYRIGLTDICKRISGNDNELTVTNNDRNEFEEKIKKYKPKIVAFTSINAYKFYKNVKISYGLQRDILFDSKIFVLPSTSPLASRFWDINYWKNLKSIYDELK